MAPAGPVRQKPYWIVVADEASAIVYARDTKRAPLRELFSLENEAARRKTGDLIADRGGRSFDSHGQGRHTMAKEKTDPKKHAAIGFAREIADRIGKAMNDGASRGFALVAAPKFLGVLRDAVARSTKAEPFAAIDKQVVGRDTSVIEKLLAER